jgi:hypothetical protein
MKTVAWMIVAAAAGWAAKAPDAPQHVTVCAPYSPGTPLLEARALTSAIFVRIGVRVEWRGRANCPAEALRVSLSTSTPEDLKFGALAYALPYEGTHIVVFLDRIRARVPERLAPRVLGHVLAHEITHILQGCAHHSGSGLMKANWDASDYREMTWGMLPFTEEDVVLIVRGMAGRESRLALRGQMTQDSLKREAEIHP